MGRLRDDRGAALIMVVLLGFVSIVLVGTGMTVAMSGLQQSVSSQRSASALDAAFAGVQDYVARLNADDSYVKYGNPLSQFTISSGSAATVTPDPTNWALDVSATGAQNRWAPVPGSDGVAKYRYEVDNSTYKVTGIVRLRTTGVSGGRTRSLVTSLRVRGFVDYSYFTDYEIGDPQMTGAPKSCEKHVWEGRPVDCGSTSTNRIPDPYFGPDDAVSGDAHSNDQMIICAATFIGNITTAYSGSPLYSTRNCPRTKAITNITHADPLPMPSTNDSMQTDAACVYTGPTQITYNANGTMTVVSPWSTGGVGDAATCGAPGQLGQPSGATVPQLDQNLLYVQNVPPTVTQLPVGLRCIDVNGATTNATDGIGWSLTQGGSTIRYPLVGEAPATTKFAVIDPQWNAALPAYGCRNGDLYVKGTITTQTTAASQNYVYVIGNTVYKDQSTDVLGLVGQNGVLVWNPMSKGADAPMLAGQDREIDAAIVSVAHTFMVQNYDRGTAIRGTLTVFGSIAQKFRGSVHASDPDTGYNKAYVYDSLLKTVSPPKFLASTATSFTVTRYAGVSAAYQPSGAPLP